jgi:hypothetical protein
LLVLCALAATACSTPEERQRAREEKERQRAEARAAKEEARAADLAQQREQGDAKMKADLPEGSPFRQVGWGMSEGEVRALLGEPTSHDSTATGAAFNPWNVRQRNTVRTTWYYQGKGRVVFVGGQGGIDTRVIDVDDDPSEKGYRATR